MTDVNEVDDEGVVVDPHGVQTAFGSAAMYGLAAVLARAAAARTHGRARRVLVFTSVFLGFVAAYTAAFIGLVLWFVKKVVPRLVDEEIDP